MVHWSVVLLKIREGVDVRLGQAVVLFVVQPFPHSTAIVVGRSDRVSHRAIVDLLPFYLHVDPRFVRDSRRYVEP